MQSSDPNIQSDTSQQTPMPAAGTGNASNASPVQGSEPSGPHQLLDKKADKYIRESGNIEDLPDPQEQQEADDIIRQENSNNH